MFEPIVQLWPHDQGPAPEEVVANAHLIAAAPELLEALKKIAEGKGPFSSDRLTHAENTIEAMRELARAAIAKAEVRHG